MSWSAASSQTTKGSVFVLTAFHSDLYFK
jgi:hypothetical protein